MVVTVNNEGGTFPFYFPLYIFFLFVFTRMESVEDICKKGDDDDALAETANVKKCYFLYSSGTFVCVCVRQNVWYVCEGVTGNMFLDLLLRS